jgi:hypothetical protein
VKVRVTSTKSARCKPGGLREREAPPASREGNRSKDWPLPLKRKLKQNLRGPLVPTGSRPSTKAYVLTRCRDGEEKSYFVCKTMRGCCSAALLVCSSRRSLLDLAEREGQAPPLQSETASPFPTEGNGKPLPYREQLAMYEEGEKTG